MLFIGKIKDLKEMVLDLNVDEKRAKHPVSIGSTVRIIAVSKIMNIGGLIQYPDGGWTYPITLDTGETLYPHFGDTICAMKDRLWLSNKVSSWLAEASPVTQEVH